MKRTPGFTLLELLVVVALVAIVTAMAAPSFNDLIARQRVRSITDELVTDIAYARSEAVARQEPVRIVFLSGADADCYTIHTNAAGAHCNCLQPPAQRCEAGATELKTVRVPRATNVTLVAAQSAASAAEVQFESNWGAAAPGAYEVEVVSSRGPQLRSRIGALGQVRVCSPNASVPGVTTSCQ